MTEFQTYVLKRLMNIYKSSMSTVEKEISERLIMDGFAYWLREPEFDETLLTPTKDIQL